MVPEPGPVGRGGGYAGRCMLAVIEPRTPVRTTAFRACQAAESPVPGPPQG
jgi:hypothetical protein